jgi:predicted metal-dependent hydrolase
MSTLYEGEKWYVSCSIKDVKELLKDNELQFVGNIFVRIEACPQWMKSQLISERLDQLEEIEEEKERQANLTKKQKRREFWRKIIPFIR